MYRQPLRLLSVLCLLGIAPAFAATRNGRGTDNGIVLSVSSTTSSESEISNSESDAPAFGTSLEDVLRSASTGSSEYEMANDVSERDVSMGESVSERRNMSIFGSRTTKRSSDM